MTSPHIAIIGAGNMGSSLIGGLISNKHPNNKICASDTNREQLAHLEHDFGINTTTNNVNAVEEADIVVFAIKPQIFINVAEELKTIIQLRKPLILSIAAGIRETSIQKWVGGHTAIVRAMPNIPALISCGATALFANRYVNDAQRSIAESILRAVGIIVWVSDETMIDTVTALSGSGPAYFFLVMEILQHVAEQLGLPHDTARLLTLQTALGAARMAIESGKSLAELRHHVTSPGGTTEKALSVLEENNIRIIFQTALQAAKSRAEELAKAWE